MELDLDSTSFFEAADKSKVPPILQKRIIAFVNHFILKTCTFLNEFVEECEIRFIETERKLQKLEATLIILEEKLASIPELKKEQNPSAQEKDDNQNKKNENENIAESVVHDEIESNIETPHEEVKGIMAKEDARYKKFFKMLQFGVLTEAIKQKMNSEGLNAEILDTPNLILPDGIPYQQPTEDS